MKIFQVPKQGDSNTSVPQLFKSFGSQQRFVSGSAPQLLNPKKPCSKCGQKKS